MKARLVRLLLLSALISGCATTGFNSQTYTVKSGDSLYFIAWKYRLNFQQLARWNNLSPPYAIFPGDRILINPVNVSGRASEKTAVRGLSTYRVRRGETLYGIARKVGVSASDIVKYNDLRRPYTIYPGQRLSLRSSGEGIVVKSSGTQAAVQQQSGSRTTKSPAPSRWLWPTEGRVVKGFKGSKTVQQGIDIAGRMGQTVRSSAAGVVVYSGSGLNSYGQLVIVKHNDSFLSAYGYNSKLLVKEGEKVKAGQAIAKMGRVGQGDPQLHFEIRKYGKPVDPIRYLPRQS